MALNNKVLFRGDAYPLNGTFPVVHTEAPDFRVNTFIDGKLNTLTKSDLVSPGTATLITTMASVDTPLSVLHTLTLEHKLRELASIWFDMPLTVLLITSDLPFTLNRFAGEHNLQFIQPVSDYIDLGFSTPYGVLMRDYRVMTRSLTLIDSEGILRYFNSPLEYEELPDLDPVFELLTDITDADSEDAASSAQLHD